MSRAQMVKVSCDRCSRVEYRDASEEDLPRDSEEHKYVFSGEYKGEKTVFEDLCSGCEAILDNHWHAAARKLKKLSPIRKNGSDG